MSTQNPIVHCEIKGDKTELTNTVVLTKVNGIFISKNFVNSRINSEEKILYSDNKPPVNFYEQLEVPYELDSVLGSLFATVEDIEDPEQSTAILSAEGLNIFMGRQLVKLINYASQYEHISIPETMFFVSATRNTQNAKLKTCQTCESSYYSTGRKYLSKKILMEKVVPGKFGELGILWPGFDVAFTDLSDKHPIGNGYMFSLEKNFIPNIFCSNDCAVSYFKS